MSGPQQILEEHGIPLDDYSLDYVARLDAELAKLDETGLKLRQQADELRTKRDEHRAKRDALVAARAYYLQEVRPAQPGDVRV